MWRVFILLLSYSCCCNMLNIKVAVQLSPGTSISPLALASKYGCNYIRQIGNLEGFHLLACSSPAHARGLGTFPPHGNLSTVISTNPAILSVYEQAPLLRSVRSYSPPNDPDWNLQWALHNVGQVGEKFKQRDLNVEPAWMQGFTGNGVVVGVIDDGIMYTHMDLKDNFDEELSVDVADMDEDVFPFLDPHTGRLERHGTSCAGILAMTKGNGMCGVGVAYESKIAGIRLLSSSPQTDADEASAFGLHNQQIHIFSNSWGPYDNGIDVEGPGPLASAALKQAILKVVRRNKSLLFDALFVQGRGGKGSIFVWAAGNGRSSGDCCSTDGYASNIFTIAVGSVDQTGQRAFYDEECPAKMVVVFHYNRPLRTTAGLRTQAVTTGVHDLCRDDFIGTSVACPLVTGAIGLALQANPALTWRDVQYLLAYTSVQEGLGSPSHQWTVNGGGLLISKEFGFGAVDAEALVSRAKHWISVPPQHSCVINTPLLKRRTVTSGQSLLLWFNVDEENCDLAFLEHVVLRVSLQMGGALRFYSYTDYLRFKYSGDETILDLLIQHNVVRRGDVIISLTSPFGTVSHLLSHRPKDFVSADGFQKWPFMSVRHWGENPLGAWLLNITYSPSRDTSGYTVVTGLELNLFGTWQPPASVKVIPKTCHEKCFGKCGGEGPMMCDVCKSLRNAHTLECMESCPASSQRHKNYCIPLTNYSCSPVAAMNVEPSPLLSTAFHNSPSYYFILSLLLCTVLVKFLYDK